MLEVTLETVGATASITSALFVCSEPAAAPMGRVRVAAFPLASLIVPLFKAKALVPCASRSAEICVAKTV